MRGGDVDNVDVGILDELLVRAIGLRVGGAARLLEELLGARPGRRRGGSDDGVLDVLDAARGGVDQQVFGAARPLVGALESARAGGVAGYSQGDGDAAGGQDAPADCLGRGHGAMN